MSQIKKGVSDTVFTTNRLEALADGVFAIVMTLLVLELSIPVIAESSVNTELPRKLLEMSPKLLVYILTFVVLGIMWVNHRFMFNYIKRSDGKLAWINITFLMVVALIPFSAALLGEYSQSQIAVVVYGVNAVLNIFMCLVIWIYITGNNQLADIAIDAEIAMRRKIMYLVGCFCFLLGIGISFINPIAALYIYGFTALLTIIITLRDSHGFLSIVLVRMLRKNKKNS
jgi:uncharacterized membrane protein